MFFAILIGLFADAAADFTAYLGREEGAQAPRKENDIALYYRGVCYMSLPDYDAAAADFTECIDVGVMAEDSLFNRGLSYLQAALTDLTACIERGAGADDAAFYRSYAYRMLGDYDAALADLNLCIEHEYSLAQTYYQRAQTYLEMGDEEKYIADLETSLNY